MRFLRAFALLPLVVVAACSSKTGCDDPKALAQLVDLTRLTASRDIAYQCERTLYEKISELRQQCEGEAAHSDECMRSCREWADKVVEAKVDSVIESFRDPTVALYSCKAKVHYAVDFDGGQEVDAQVRYYVKPEIAGPKVELAK